MTWLFWLFGIGIVPLVLFVLVIGGLVLYFTGSIGIDGLFAMTEKQGTLTCWHCGEETRAGRKTCTHCGGELQ